ncbi:MAG: 4Fe-4S cluster-binding domain-containing protein [Spirochaetaceae bacterium]|jgi:MoaA/NifB/PqqE/SkfB family radical SAM enzyme|nr:4Fe-4S cluster-binding domain-containing protein [Spirochaetaceae bacterium]
MYRLRENLEMTIGSIIRKTIKPQSRAYKNLQILYRYFLSAKRTKKLKLLKFGVGLADHCNLNCAGCGNYSPLAKERFYDIETFRNDCKRLSELTGGNIASIGFAGGEPLLHPKITDFFDIARSFFNNRNWGGGG